MLPGLSEVLFDTDFFDNAEQFFIFFKVLEAIITLDNNGVEKLFQHDLGLLN